MEQKNNEQNSVIFSIAEILGKMSNQVSFLIRNNKLMSQLDVDMLMENTRKLYDTVCSVRCNMDVDSIPMEVEDSVGTETRTETESEERIDMVWDFTDDNDVEEDDNIEEDDDIAEENDIEEDSDSNEFGDDEDFDEVDFDEVDFDEEEDDDDDDDDDEKERDKGRMTDERYAADLMMKQGRSAKRTKELLLERGVNAQRADAIIAKLKVAVEKNNKMEAMSRILLATLITIALLLFIVARIVNIII